jgi:hypothetical protein
MRLSRVIGLLRVDKIELIDDGEGVMHQRDSMFIYRLKRGPCGGLAVGKLEEESTSSLGMGLGYYYFITGKIR